MMNLLQDGSWHREGLFMGMHWAWWIVWIATLAVLAWALWLLHVEREEARREGRRAIEETKPPGGR